MKNKPEIRFKGFTDDWEQRKLGETKTYFTDGNYGEAYPSANDMSDKENGVPFLRGSDFSNGYLDASKANYITKEKHNELTSGHLKKDDIVLAVRGSLGTLGYTTEVNEGWNINSQLAILRTDKNEFLGIFLIQYFLSNKGQKEILSRNTGTALKQLPIKQIKDIPVPMPDISEQQKIGQFFKQLDDTIALHQRKLELLKEQKKGFLQKMFPKPSQKVPEIRFEGFTDDWEQRKLGEVIKIENGYAFKSTYFLDTASKYIVLTPGNIAIGGGFQYGKGRFYDKVGEFPSKFFFKPGEIFITLTDLTPTAQALGFPAIVPNDQNVYLHNQRLGKIVDSSLDNQFLYSLLRTDTYHKEIVATASGTTVKHSSIAKILDYSCSLPSIKEQQKIGIFFEKLDHTIDLHQQKLELLKKQKQSLLQRMFV